MIEKEVSSENEIEPILKYLDGNGFHIIKNGVAIPMPDFLHKSNFPMKISKSENEVFAIDSWNELVEFVKEEVITDLKEKNDVEISFRLTDSGVLQEYFPPEIDNIVEGQLEGYGYASGKIFGQLVRIDTVYSDTDIVQVCATTPYDLLDNAIDFRTELMNEEYGNKDEYDMNDESVRELMKMEAYQDTMLKERNINGADKVADRLTSENVFNVNVIHESDTENGMPTLWGCDIGSKEYGKFLWIEKTDNGYDITMDGELDMKKLDNVESLTNAVEWIAENVEDIHSLDKDKKCVIAKGTYQVFDVNLDIEIVQHPHEENEVIFYSVIVDGREIAELNSDDMKNKRPTMKQAEDIFDEYASERILDEVEGYAMSGRSVPSEEYLFNELFGKSQQLDPEECPKYSIKEMKKCAEKMAATKENQSLKTVEKARKNDINL